MPKNLPALLIAGLLLTGLCFYHAGPASQSARAEEAAEGEPMLAHNVYFSLKDSGPAATKQIVDDCHKYLAPQPGIVFYAAGTLSALDRPVNDRDYDVALHVVFKDRAALDAYLVAPKHLEFVAKHKANWEKVRVFDSDVTGAPK